MGNLTKYLFLVFAFFTLTDSVAQTKLMTFNIRYDNPNDKENWWEHRKEEVIGLMTHYGPSFIGIQEGLNRQVKYLNWQLADYEYIGVSRYGAKEKGEFTAIFYNYKEYELLNATTFWLSPTPNQISKGWDASLNRICTYGAFRNKKTQEVIHVFNCHFDHRGKLARKESAKVILNKIKEFGIENERIIVMGDMNCQPTSDPIQVFESMLDDTRNISQKPSYGPIGTFNSFNPHKVLKRRIDYIFSKNINILSHRQIDDRRQNGLCVSDHLPIMVEIE